MEEKNNRILTPEQRQMASDNYGLAKSAAGKFCSQWHCPHLYEDMVGVAGLTLCRATMRYVEGTVGREDAVVVFASYYFAAAYKEMVREMRRVLGKGLGGVEHELKRRRSTDASDLPSVMRFGEYEGESIPQKSAPVRMEVLEEAKRILEKLSAIPEKYRESVREVLLGGSPTEAARKMAAEDERVVNRLRHSIVSYSNRIRTWARRQEAAEEIQSPFASPFPPPSPSISLPSGEAASEAFLPVPDEGILAESAPGLGDRD